MNTADIIGVFNVLAQVAVAVVAIVAVVASLRANKKQIESSDKQLKEQIKASEIQIQKQIEQKNVNSKVAPLLFPQRQSLKFLLNKFQGHNNNIFILQKHPH